MTESLSPFPRKDKEIVSAFKGMHRREYYTAMTEEESKHWAKDPGAPIDKEWANYVDQLQQAIERFNPGYY